MKTYVLYGLIIAVCGAVVILVEDILGLPADPDRLRTGLLVRSLCMLVFCVAGIVIGIRVRRAQLAPDQVFSYGRALGTGVAIALFAGLFAGGFNFIYVKFINPDYPEAIVQLQLARLRHNFEAKHVTVNEATMERAEKVMRFTAQPVAESAASLVNILFEGTLIALVASAFLKRAAAPPRLPPT